MKLFAITFVLSLLCFTLAGLLPPWGIIVACCIAVGYVIWMMERTDEKGELR